ncbi:MAG: hypothetical protein EOP83_02250 [Verrucomicrobiaceae bacterium]|nr:MAG: hypothetical protein EOP83_02250 [Verrucomicrobiaceae bacterium]
MKTVLPLFMLLFPILLAAQDEKLDQLVTVDGKSYQAVTVRKVEPDGLSILHEAGTAKIPFEKLSTDLQVKYGYDKEAAAEHRKQLAEVQRLQDAAERDASKKREKATADQASAKVAKEFADQVQKAAKMLRVEAIQNASIGLIGDVEEATLASEAVKSSLGSTVGEKPAWRFQERAKDGVVSATTGAEVKYSIDETGPRPVKKEFIWWEGRAWRIGQIQYKTLQGLLRTVPHYTASEKTAAAFYKKNGFSPKSDKITRKAR